MRFMMIVKHAENQGPPPKGLMDAIGKLVEDEAKTGKMVGSGGLTPTAQGARVRLSGGQVTITDAIESARVFMELHKKHWPGWEGETEIRQMYGLGEGPPSV
jgi:hypothetical protein